MDVWWLMEVLLMVVGAVLVLVTFGLAFTIYGEISFVAGIACFVTAVPMFVRRLHAVGTTRPGQQQARRR